MTNLFIINVKYTASLEVIESILPKHRQYLQAGYEAGFLLASGPQNPRVGGTIIGKFKSIQQAKDFTLQDPYYLNNVAMYDIIEFTPVLSNHILQDFLQFN